MYVIYKYEYYILFFFFSSRRRHTRLQGDWSSDVCSSDLPEIFLGPGDSHIEQPSFLGSGDGRGGVGDRNEAVLQADEGHGRPLEALGPVEGGELHRVGVGIDLGGGPVAHGGRQ